MKRKLSREEAEQLADELLTNQRRQSGGGLAKSIAALVNLDSETPQFEFERNPWVTPAAPAWEVMHRHVDTTGKW